MDRTNIQKITRNLRYAELRRHGFSPKQARKGLDFSQKRYDHLFSLLGRGFTHAEAIDYNRLTEVATTANSVS